MRVMCPGWHRADGSRVHEDRKFLGHKPPMHDQRESDGQCAECHEAVMGQAKARKEEPVAAVR